MRTLMPLIIAAIFCASLSTQAETKSKNANKARLPAQVSADVVNRTAMEILIKNSGRMTSQEGETVAQILSRSLSTEGATNNKIMNNCSFDNGDEIFKCILTISNRDDQAKPRTESTLTIQYQLERLSNGRPSENLFYLSVQVDRAG